MASRGDGDDPGWRALDEQVRESVGEQVGGEVIDRERLLDPLGGLGSSLAEDARVVHQRVESIVTRTEFSGESPYCTP